MFCSNCGCKLVEGARFCSNCGKEVMQNEPIAITVCEETDSDYELYENYIQHMQTDILDKYLNNKDNKASDYYAEAKLYEMPEESVDRAYNKYIANIEKLMKFIGGYHELHKIFIVEDQNLDEIISYGIKLEFGDGQVRALNKYYENVNDLYGRQLMFRYLFDKKYGKENKKICKLVDFTKIPDEVAVRLQSELDIEVQKIEKILDDQYCRAKDYTLTKEQIQEVYESINDMYLQPKQLRIIIFKYKEKKGINQKLVELKIASIDDRLNKRYPPKVLAWHGYSHEFTYRYFLEDMIRKEYSKVYDDSCTKINAIDLSKDDALLRFDELLIPILSDTQNVIDRWNIELCDGEGSDTSKGNKKDKSVQLMLYMRQASKIAQEKWEETFIEEEAKRQYREMRKQSRARWSGGGFGVEGAIKGAMTAGALNAVGGIGHSIFNGIGNSCDRAKYRERREEIGRILVDKFIKEYKSFVYGTLEEFIKKVNRELPGFFKHINTNTCRKETLEKNMLIEDRQELDKKIFELLKEYLYDKNIYTYIFSKYSTREDATNLCNIASQIAGLEIKPILRGFVQKKYVETMELESDNGFENAKIISSLRYTLYDKNTYNDVESIINEKTLKFFSHADIRNDFLKIEKVVLFIKKYYKTFFEGERLEVIYKNIEIMYIKQINKNITSLNEMREVIQQYSHILELCPMRKIMIDENLAGYQMLFDKAVELTKNSEQIIVNYINENGLTEIEFWNYFTMFNVLNESEKREHVIDIMKNLSEVTWGNAESYKTIFNWFNWMKKLNDKAHNIFFVCVLPIYAARVISDALKKKSLITVIDFKNYYIMADTADIKWHSCNIWKNIFINSKEVSEWISGLSDDDINLLARQLSTLCPLIIKNDEIIIKNWKRIRKNISEIQYDLEMENGTESNDEMDLRKNITKYILEDFGGKQLKEYFRICGTAEYYELYTKNWDNYMGISKRGEKVIMIYAPKGKLEWIITDCAIYNSQSKRPLLGFDAVQEFKLEKNILRFQMLDGWKGCILEGYGNQRGGIEEKWRDIALIRIMNCIIADHVGGDRMIKVKGNGEDIVIYDKKCSSCNALNKSISKYCSQCGNDQFRTICFRCGKENAVETKYCSNCGFELMRENGNNGIEGKNVFLLPED